MTGGVGSHGSSMCAGRSRRTDTCQRIPTRGTCANPATSCHESNHPSAVRFSHCILAALAAPWLLLLLHRLCVSALHDPHITLFYVLAVCIVRPDLMISTYYHIRRAHARAYSTYLPLVLCATLLSVALIWLRPASGADWRCDSCCCFCFCDV